MEASTYLFYEYPSNFKFSLSFILASDWLELNDVIRLDSVLLKNNNFRNDIMRLLKRELKPQDSKSYLTWIARCRQYNGIIITTPQYRFKKCKLCTSIKTKLNLRTYLKVTHEADDGLVKMNINDNDGYDDIEDIGNELLSSSSSNPSSNPSSSSSPLLFLGPKGMFERCKNCYGCISNTTLHNNNNNNNHNDNNNIIDDNHNDNNNIIDDNHNDNNNIIDDNNNNNNNYHNNNNNRFITPWPLCSQICHPLQRSSLGGKKWGNLLIHDDSYDHTTGVHLSLKTHKLLHLDSLMSGVINSTVCTTINTTINTTIATTPMTTPTIMITATFPTPTPTSTPATPRIGPTAMMERCQNCQGCVSVDGSKMLTWPGCKVIC